MHNIALLGFSVPGQAIRYDVPMSLLSGLVAVAVVFAALVIAGSGGAGFPRLLLGGIVIGGGVLFSMDFVGMAAMRMPDTIRYNAWGVLLSVLIAVAAATLLLWAALRQRGIGPAVAASVAMGVAISGMHYMAMAAMRFIAAPGAAGMLGGVTAAQFVAAADRGDQRLDLHPHHQRRAGTDRGTDPRRGRAQRPAGPPPPGTGLGDLRGRPRPLGRAPCVMILALFPRYCR